MPGDDHKTKPISLFYSYSHKDEELRMKLEDHLGALKWCGMIAEWHDRDIMAGREWENEIDHHLFSADIILLLVSASFIASEYCWSVEIKKALKRHERGDARVIPVILRPCRWQRTPFAKLQATPKDARPVTRWHDRDLAFDDVVSKIEAVVEELQRSLGQAASPTAGGVELKTGKQVGRGLLTPLDTLGDFTVFQDVYAPWCPEMVRLPAGEFLMGSPESEEGRFADEGPQHRVTIGSRLAMGCYPVTFEEYDWFCAATRREKPWDQGWGRGRRPVINVSWHDAHAYVEWLAKQTAQLYRLPSEAEWEYAARAGTETRYAFGDEISDKVANFGMKFGKTTEVATFAANPWGLYDMHGNVWEWCADGKRAYAPAAVTDPMGPPGTNPNAKRVLRGGSWFSEKQYVRSACRRAIDSNDPSIDDGPQLERSASRRAVDLSDGSIYDGFRCARVLP